MKKYIKKILIKYKIQIIIKKNLGFIKIIIINIIISIKIINFFYYIAEKETI